jgi:hypothetical protein
VELRQLLGQIAAQWDRSLGTTGEAQKLLRGAGDTLVQWVPGGYMPVGSGGKGAAAHCPWIAVFDPDETTSAQRGMYVVYLFAADMSTVALTLNQGVTDQVKEMGRPAARLLFARQAEAIRAGFDPDAVKDLDTTIDLRKRESLPVDYELANIFSLTYDLADLPSEVQLVEDLRRFVRLYEDALQSRMEASRAGGLEIVVPAPAGKTSAKKAAEFKPKSDADYRQTIAAQDVIRSKKHETLVRKYGEYLIDRGFTPATNVHPRDLTAERKGVHWLVEAKIVRGGSGVVAAREAFAQLFFYERFCYDAGDGVTKLALFNESVGPACTDWLEEHGIAVVWKDGLGWAGSPMALKAELCGA